MMNTIPETIGDRIRKLRLHYKYNSKDSSTWNIANFASRCGISPSALSQIERNIIKNPSMDIVTKIAKELNISVDYLLYGKSQKNKEKTHFDPVSFLKKIDLAELKNLSSLSDIKKRLLLKASLALSLIESDDILPLIESILDQIIAFLSNNPLDKKEIVIEEAREEKENENPYVSRVNDVIL